MKIVGYADRFSVAAEETIRFQVSCELPRYRADIVRLIHGDPNPRGPGVKEELMPSAVSGEYTGRQQALHKGSYVVIPDHPRLRLRASFTLQAWIFPTTPQKGAQGLLTKWSATEGKGYGLFIDEGGELALWLGSDTGKVVRLRSGHPLRTGEWYFVAGTYDAQCGQVYLYQEPLREWPYDDTRGGSERAIQVHALGENTAPFLIAAIAHGSTRTSHHFNGKIDSPRLFNRTLSRDEIAALKHGAAPQAFAQALVAVWDFAADISSSKVTDTSPQAMHGETVNLPARAMTGYNWTGKQTNFQHARQEYGAIHFHDDDLEDAGWDTDFTLTIPAQWKSGVYAARLRSADSEEYIPFFVRPKRGTASARIAFLIPTASYLAYANIQLRLPSALAPHQKSSPPVREDNYIVANRLLSLYDLHSDGSGVCYSSRLRPILNMRPKVRTRALGSPHLFPADLHLTDWLEAKGYAYDVITDEDLHQEGLELLAPYRVILTGSHPEYWSGAMFAALETYLQRGGRLMYLGGNGFYWVTSFAPDRPHVIEVRRWAGIRAWEAQPGERHHSTTGELGGLWRFRGRAPQRLVGVGFTAQGFDSNRPYRRLPGSFDPRAAFIFEGVGRDELIGDFPSLVLHHGAAGFELDRAEAALGTPPHALVLASASGFSDSYQHVVEEVLMSDSRQGGTVNSRVRADMVYFEYPNNGAVFSVGSIAWCGSLSYNNYDNNVSRITDNVLRRFVSDKPLS
jgi:N,N-dimethylformamidase